MTCTSADAGRRWWPCAWLACLTLVEPSTQAGLIDAVASSGSGGTCGSFDLALFEVDCILNATGSGTAVPGSGYVDLQFSIENATSPDPTLTEYELTVNVTNSSGVDWAAHVHLLGFEVEDSDPTRPFGATFEASNGSDGLDFDEPDDPLNPLPTSTDYGLFEAPPDVLSAYDVIAWSDGTVSDGATTTFTFSVDVPNYNPLQMPEDAEVDDPFLVGYLFTLRQWALVPEPGTALLWLALAASGMRRRRRWVSP